MTEKKYLSQKDIAELLDLPLVTIQRWEHQGKIPFKIINQKKCYKKKEILEWAKSHDFAIKSLKDQKTTKIGKVLSQAIERGGIYDNIQGEDIYSVFKNTIKKLSYIDNLYKDLVLDELLNREELTSTGIGKGFAIPHTRNRLNLGLEETYVSVVFLKKAIEFNFIDGLPVNTLFMIFSINTKEHLKILAEISYILQEKKILSILHEKNKNNDLIKRIIQIDDKS
jgi:PTS system nitrogen regulatory IIA component